MNFQHPCGVAHNNGGSSQISIESRQGLPNYNSGAQADLWRLARILKDDFANPRVIVYLVTDCTDRTWLQGAKATVHIEPVPTRANMREVVRFALSKCKAHGKCILWYSGHGGLDALGGQFLVGLHPSEYITATEFNSWLTDIDSTVSLLIFLDACYAGRFLNLPYYFNTQGRLLTCIWPGFIATGPRIICIAASHREERAHEARSNLGRQYGSLSWFLLEYLLVNSGTVYLRNIEADLRTSLSDPEGTWTQRPHVSMSYHDEDAELSLS